VAYDDERFSGKRRLCNRGFQNSVWRVIIDDHRILFGAHIDDFVIACADRPVLDAFRKHLLETFEGTYEGPLQ